MSIHDGARGSRRRIAEDRGYETEHERRISRKRSAALAIKARTTQEDRAGASHEDRAGRGGAPFGAKGKARGPAQRLGQNVP